MDDNYKDYQNEDYQNEDYQNEDYQNEDYQNEDYQNEDYQNEDYQKEDYHGTEYQNATVPEESSHNLEGHSTSEHLKRELVTLDQGCENAAEQEYEYIPFSGMWMRMVPEELNADPALYVFEDDKWRIYPRKLYIIFCVVLLSSLIMTTATLVMACLRCIPLCPNDWNQFQEKCYYTSEERNTWQHSRSICQSKGADLVVIDHAKEQDFLENKTKRNVWIGLNYKEAEEVWMWVDGTRLSYNNWQMKTSFTKGAPRKDYQGYRAECVVAEQEHNFQWMNYPCRIASPSAFCEKSRHVVCVLQSPFWP